MSTDNYNNDAKFTIEDDELHPIDTEELPSVDDIVVEELPDSEAENHDQLPSVEEYKAGMNTKSSSSWQMEYLISLAVTTLIVIIASVLTFTLKGKSSGSGGNPVGRTAAVEQFLFTNEVSTLPDLQSIGSPQHKATAFIADGDTLQMPLTAETSRRFVERYVLALLYYTYAGHEWTFSLKFLSGRDHCEWYDDLETSSGNVVRQGVICNDDGHVKSLNLAWNNLKGNNIPNEIGYLGDLESLHMYYNDIGGYFPDCFRGMPNLKAIGLMRTGIIGTLPQWIGEMTQLTTLALGDNSMHGTIPTSISKLSNLKLLGLDGNGGFTGSMNMLKSLKNLEALYLESNQLTGNLHNFNWPNLIELDVSNNLLDESFPDELLNHPTLQVLDVNTNMMFGPIPEDIFQNTKLEFFAAHNAGFVGTIPDRLAFLVNLKHLDISFNVFSGTIPDTITQMTNLHYLATSSNGFSSQPMLDLSKLTNLLDLSMKNNNITGTLPEWIGELSNLQLLDLDANNLSGSIPSWIGLLQSLDYLLLNRNKFTGTIPTQIENLHHLKVLLLDGNSISGNANAVCNSENVNPTYFVADCYPGQNGERPEIDCRCCTQCCTDNDTSCNDKKWTSNIDPVWEYGYIRPQYSFSLDNAPIAYSKEGDVEIDNGIP